MSNLKDENKKSILKKKASLIMNNLNKTFQNVMEILRKVLVKKEIENK